MLDRSINALTKPWLQALAKGLVRVGVSSPNRITAVAFVLGLMSAGLIARGHFVMALGVMLLSRLCDGLDGAMARVLGRTSDRGGFLDITLDFVFYASIPLGFALYAPVSNALAACVLLFAFMGTASSFLAYAAIVHQRESGSDGDGDGYAPPKKAIYYLGGLTEGFETLACFALMCWMPANFPVLAYGFAALCGCTTLMRVRQGWRDFA